MKTHLEDISSVKKKLSVEVEPGDVDKKLDAAYRRLGRQARIPGFRPGKIPRKILETRFGEQVMEDVSRDLIGESLPEAITELAVFPLGTPLIEKETIKTGEPFRYSATMEVRPRLEVKDYLNVAVEKEKVSVTEADVQKQLEQIREGNGKLTAVSGDRAAQTGDYVVLEYRGFVDGEPLEGIHSDNFLLKIGSNDFHPRFEESLVGLGKGREADIHVDFEENYYHSKLAGKGVDFKVKIHDIKEMVLPDLDDTFAKNLGAGFNDLSELKEKIRENLTDRENRRVEKELKQRLIETVCKEVECELPQTLVASEISYAVENIRQNFIRSGASLEKMGFSEEKMRDEFRPQAEKRVKELLVLGEIARAEGLEINEEDIEEGLKELSQSTGQDVAILRKYYEARDLMGSLKEKLLEEKTLNYLVEHANISEVDKVSDDDRGSEKENR
ncbi:MAG: trigger factor [Deltaproteobacteria bacterium]|nr:MAG: trigger factor [Deltaproteobacteria bacterium]